ncbi:MAG: hypothetical protein ACRDN0_12650 [Trebonia sp.]
MEDQADKRAAAGASGLSASEFLLVRQAGFTAAGFVTGTSVFRHALVAGAPTRGDLTVAANGKNYDGRPATGAAELEALSIAVYAARDAAMARWRAWPARRTRSAPTGSSAPNWP